MNTRNTLYILTLMAYMLSLAHSVIPHHHHKTAQEATAHKQDDHHHNAGKSHHHHDHDESDQKEEKSGETGHFFFFSHDANVDVLIKHSSIDKPVKSKNIQTSVPVIEQVISSEISEHLVYHPPQGDPSLFSTILSSLAQRGPPSC